MVTDRVASPPAWPLKRVRPSSSQRRIRDCSRNVHGQRGRRCGPALDRYLANCSVGCAGSGNWSDCAGRRVL